MNKIFFALTIAVWVAAPLALQADPASVCDDAPLRLVANQAGPIHAAVEAKPAQRVRIVSVDTQRGTVKARPTNSQEVLTFRLSASAAKSLRVGQTVGFDYLAARGLGSDRFCPCGQKNDGSCWCTGEKPCCGPLAGCPIGSCDKKQPIPNLGDKPIFEGTPGSGSGL